MSKGGALVVPFRREKEVQPRQHAVSDWQRWVQLLYGYMTVDSSASEA
jgi:hypothetical protein